MAEVTYRPAHVKGEVRIPPSKSAAHRALLSAALCKTPCRVGPIDHSADMEATLNGVCAMGGTVKAEENGVLCIAPGTAPQSVTVDCGESGSTLRFLIPVFAALGIEATFVGHGRLPERPIGVYTDLLPQHGVTVETAGGLPFHITGKLQSGDFRVPGNISSQFITGLLFALPLLKKDSTVTLTTPLESKGYIDLTIEVLAGFGVKIEETETGWHISGGQTYRAEHYTVEGDWSQAAFFLSEAAVSGGPIRLLGLSGTSLQGDKACVHLWRQFGLSVTEENGVYVAENKKIATEFIKESIPEIHVVSSLATYLLWIDFSEFTDNVDGVCDLLRSKEGIFLSKGSEFGPSGKNFVRMNVACPRQVLLEALLALRGGLHTRTMRRYLEESR